MKTLLTFLLTVSSAFAVERADVVVVAATPGGIAAAVSAARSGSSVILLEEKSHVGAIAPNLAQGHGYEHYPALFSRTIPWEQRAGLAKGIKASSSEGEATTKPKKKRKAKECGPISR